MEQDGAGGSKVEQGGAGVSKVEQDGAGGSKVEQGGAGVSKMEQDGVLCCRGKMYYAVLPRLTARSIQFLKYLLC